MKSMKRHGNNTIDNLKYAIETAKVKAAVVDMISKLQVALCFPILPEVSDEELNVFLNDDELLLVKSMFSDTDISRKSQENINDDLSEISLLSQIDHIINSYNIKYRHLIKRDNEDLCRLLYSLLENEKVTKFCRDNLLSKISDQAYDFIVKVQSLLEIILIKLQEPPEVVEWNEIELHQMYQYNEKAEDRYENTKAELTLQSKANKDILKKCDDKLNDIKRRINIVHTTSQEILEKCTAEADTKMDWDWKLSEYKQETLEEDAKNIEAKLDKFKKDNIVEEKELRVKRYKVEQQLKTVLEKYDSDMEDRQEQYDAIIAVFNEEQKALNLFQKKFYEQEAEYKVLMKEKEEFEKKIWEERLYVIQCKIAARKIQRYFRAFIYLIKEYGNVKKKKK